MFQPVRGTHDFLPEEMSKHLLVIEKARQISCCYGFEEIQTPIFEFSGVFHRLGETSDIISKETYSFEDRGGEALTLRPEGTAPVMRAVLSNGLTQNIPLKFFYQGPMFRYDRPQKGRYRQFHQIGAELVGPAVAEADAEVIALAQALIESLKFSDEVMLHLNTLGDKESRALYREALVTYFSKYQQDLSKESQTRLEQNPLRILDSKDAKDQKLLTEAPLFGDFLTTEAQVFFEAVQEKLNLLGVSFHLNPRLVRGLDYYCHTAFEFVSEALGAQGTVLAGGRYDGLLKNMGGPDLPGVGWAGGVERLQELMSLEPQKQVLISLIPMGAEAAGVLFKLANDLRKSGFRVDLGYSGNMSKRLKKANRLQAKVAVLLGEDELESRQVTVRDLETGVQNHVAFEGLKDYLKEILQSRKESFS